MAIVRIQLRRDTAANWTSANPVLAPGEVGLETDTDQIKIGDGSTAWTSLAYGGIQGPAGETGPQGEQGVQGIQGIQGEPGLDGTDGADGADGGFDSTQTVETVGTSRALTSADAGKLILNSAAITVTVEGLSVGQQVDFFRYNGGDITFQAGSGVTLTSKDGNLKIAARYSPASIKCIATGVYALLGDLGA